MDAIKINTTQNVSLSYSAAGIGPRILSGLLDLIFKYAYSAIITIIFSIAIKKETYSHNYEEHETYNQIIIGLLILCLLPAAIYNLLCETFLDGQSFGKKILKIKVVKLSGTQPNFGSYLIRSMFRLIDLPIVAIVTIAVSKNSQRFGDMIAGTTVIQINKAISINDTILNKQKPNYQIVYPQVALLSDKDANTIKEVLDFSLTQNQPEHLKLLSKKIRDKYAIAGVPKNDQQFLNTLLMDYTNYQFEK